MGLSGLLFGRMEPSGDKQLRLEPQTQAGWAGAPAPGQSCRDEGLLTTEAPGRGRGNCAPSWVAPFTPPQGAPSQHRPAGVQGLREQALPGGESLARSFSGHSASTSSSPKAWGTGATERKPVGDSQMRPGAPRPGRGPLARGARPHPAPRPGPPPEEKEGLLPPTRPVEVICAWAPAAAEPQC